MSPALRPIGTRFEEFAPGWPASADPEDNVDHIFTYEVVRHEKVQTVFHVPGDRIEPTEVIKVVDVRPATEKERKSHAES